MGDVENHDAFGTATHITNTLRSPYFLTATQHQQIVHKQISAIASTLLILLALVVYFLNNHAAFIFTGLARFFKTSACCGFVTNSNSTTGGHAEQDYHTKEYNDEKKLFACCGFKVGGFERRNYKYGSGRLRPSFRDTMRDAGHRRVSPLGHAQALRVWSLGLTCREKISKASTLVWMSVASKTRITPTALFVECATERQAAVQKAGKIALHVSGDKIYRFAPGPTRAPSTISVSIDLKSFTHLTVYEKRLLRNGLLFTPDTSNAPRLGLEFVFVEGERRGFVELHFGGKKTGVWAATTFPDPLRTKYTVCTYAATFELQYYSAIPNILCHEFAHLLCSESPCPSRIPHYVTW